MTCATGSFLAASELGSTVAAIVFYGAAALAVVSAIVAAAAPRIVHAAFALLGSFIGVAALYALLGADFVALTQVLVYVGGILVLLVFGVLLTARVRARLGLESRPKALVPVLAGVLVFAALFFGISDTDFRADAATDAPEPTTAEIGKAFLHPERHLVAFELASVLLLAALIGAAYLVRRRRPS
jgi:NADH-quinone oxidoreductase subunit J